MPFLGHKLEHMPGHKLEHVPKHVPDRHVLDRHVPQHVLGNVVGLKKNSEKKIGGIFFFFLEACTIR